MFDVIKWLHFFGIYVDVKQSKISYFPDRRGRRSLQVCANFSLCMPIHMSDTLVRQENLIKQSGYRKPSPAEKVPRNEADEESLDAVCIDVFT